MKSASAALLSGLLLSGCVDAPSTVPLVPEVAPQTLGLDAQAAPPVQTDWWAGFQDPQIDRLAKQMLAANPTLQGALARIRAAQAELSASRTGDYPQAAFDGQVQRTLLSEAYVYPARYGGTYQWVGDTQARMNWSLDFWGKQAALIDKARAATDAAALDAAAARLALTGTFAQAYINLLLAYQNADIADQTAVELGNIVELTESRVSSGLENEAALEQARALLSLARIDAMRTKAQREMGTHAIAALTGQGAAAYDSITRPVLALETALPLPANLPADLLARRPDILAARARIEAAMKGRQAAHADFYPNINLTAAIGFQSVGLASLLTGNAFTYGAGPAIHLPVFDAGRIRAQYAGATAGLDAAVADYNAAVLEAIRQTADAVTQVRSLEDQRPEQQAALDSAARAFSLAEERYRLGLAGQIPMLTAEHTLLQARRQMAALAAQTAIQRVTLLLSTGGGFNPSRADATQDKTP